MLSRRNFLAGSALAAGAIVLGRGSGPVYGQPLAPPPVPMDGASVGLRLIAAERPTSLPAFAGKTLPLWTFTDDTWLPVVRVPIGARLDVELENRLPREDQHASIHWHGIRLPNDQDGVPYLVQDPVFPGSSYRYSFVPPDTGTFFFHTHCNTPEHLGRGLHGILIVDGDTTEPYDADEVLLIRDWRVDVDAGAFLSFTTNRGAARAGTYGPLRTVNGEVQPTITLPAAGDCRLRLVNVDPTRMVEIGIEDAEAAIIAIDGIAIPPTPLGRWLLGPAMRCDIVVRAPADGRSARLIDYRPDEPLVLATLSGAGDPRRTSEFAPAALRAGIVPEPDLAAAETVELTFGSSRTGRVVAGDDPLLGPLGELCLSTGDFWTINQAGWPDGGHQRLPLPLATLERGRTYRFVLHNGTELLHPIHIHGHSPKLVHASRQTLPTHFGDTFLVMPEETVEVAFVADNPGRWMVHCHVAEHQETGMMGYYIVR